jgi:uncharacterized protein with HEPN domain
MTPSERERLAHIVEAARDALDFVSGRSRANLDDDRQLRRALIHCFMVIGEAAGRISPETRTTISTIPWREMRNMRNIVVHAYAGIDLDVLWDTTTNDLPPLVTALESALAASFPS